MTAGSGFAWTGGFLLAVLGIVCAAAGAARWPKLRLPRPSAAWSGDPRRLDGTLPGLMWTAAAVSLTAVGGAGMLAAGDGADRLRPLLVCLVVGVSALGAYVWAIVSVTLVRRHQVRTRSNHVRACFAVGADGRGLARAIDAVAPGLVLGSADAAVAVCSRDLVVPHDWIALDASRPEASAFTGPEAILPSPPESRPRVLLLRTQPSASGALAAVLLATADRAAAEAVERAMDAADGGVVSRASFSAPGATARRLLVVHAERESDGRVEEGGAVGLALVWHPDDILYVAFVIPGPFDESGSIVDALLTSLMGPPRDPERRRRDVRLRLRRAEADRQPHRQLGDRRERLGSGEAARWRSRCSLAAGDRRVRAEVQDEPPSATMPPPPPGGPAPVPWSVPAAFPGSADTGLLEAALRRRHRLVLAAMSAVDLGAAAAAFVAAPVPSDAWSLTAALVALLLARLLTELLFARWMRRSFRPAAARVAWYRGTILTRADAVGGGADPGQALQEADRLEAGSAWDRWRGARLRTRLEGREPATADPGPSGGLTDEQRRAALSAERVEAAAGRLRAGGDWLQELLSADPDLSGLPGRSRRARALDLAWLPILLVGILVSAAGAASPPAAWHGYTVEWGSSRPTSGRFAHNGGLVGGAPDAIAEIDAALPAGRQVGTIALPDRDPWPPGGAFPVVDWYLTDADAASAPSRDGMPARRVYALLGAFASTGRARVLVQYGDDASGTLVVLEIDRAPMQRALDLLFPG